MKRILDFKVDIIVEPDESGFHAYCPALKGLHVHGDTIRETRENAREAAIAYLQSLMKHGEPIPVGVVVVNAKETKKAQRKPGGHIIHHTEDLEVACPT